jgi:nicotinamide-nucleotide amidase
MDLRKAVLAALKERRLTVATAESCTGGLLSAALTDLGGSSAVFKGGVVSYWTEVKREVLGVSRETLDCYGAVSPQTAQEMAQRTRELVGSDLGVSVTGVAGPDRDERGNPVGCVYVALSDGESTIVRRPPNLGTEREEIRRNTVEYALKLLLEYCGA